MNEYEPLELTAVPVPPAKFVQRLAGLKLPR